MKLFKNYKKMYNEEKIEKEDYINSLKKAIKINNKNVDKVQELKKEVARLKIELEDTKGFLEQEKACSNALRKERTNLQRVKTRYENKLKANKEA